MGRLEPRSIVESVRGDSGSLMGSMYEGEWCIGTALGIVNTFGCSWKMRSAFAVPSRLCGYMGFTASVSMPSFLRELIYVSDGGTRGTGRRKR